MPPPSKHTQVILVGAPFARVRNCATYSRKHSRVPHHPRCSRKQWTIYLDVRISQYCSRRVRCVRHHHDGGWIYQMETHLNNGGGLRDGEGWWRRDRCGVWTWRHEKNRQNEKYIQEDTGAVEVKCGHCVVTVIYDDDGWWVCVSVCVMENGFR